MRERPKNGSNFELQSVNTGAQTFENMVISRVENGALNVSKLIPTR
jgi:hypothetical protein